jgi:predicted phosphodiesterase
MLEGIDPKEFEKLKKECSLNWKIPKGRTGIEKNKYKGFTKYLVVADVHIPKHNEPCIKAVLKLMDDENFDALINLGDYMDMEPISHWTKNKRKTLEGRRLYEDYVVGNILLDEFDKRLPKNAPKYYFWGNHEDWYNQFIEELPALEGFADPTKELKLIERGYKVFPYNHQEKFGKLTITHGIYACADSTKKHLDELKVNVMFGHTHTQAEKYASSEARLLAFGGYNLGCLCDMAPDFMRGRPHKWTHGFAILYVDKKTGDFFVDLKRIVKGRFIHNNKIYDGNK